MRTLGYCLAAGLFGLVVAHSAVLAVRVHRLEDRAAVVQRELVAHRDVTPQNVDLAPLTKAIALEHLRTESLHTIMLVLIGEAVWSVDRVALPEMPGTGWSPWVVQAEHGSYVAKGGE